MRERAIDERSGQEWGVVQLTAHENREQRKRRDEMSRTTRRTVFKHTNGPYR